MVPFTPTMYGTTLGEIAVRPSRETTQRAMFTSMILLRTLRESEVQSSTRSVKFGEPIS